MHSFKIKSSFFLFIFIIISFTNVSQAEITKPKKLVEISIDKKDLSSPQPSCGCQVEGTKVIKNQVLEPTCLEMLQFCLEWAEDAPNFPDWMGGDLMDLARTVACGGAYIDCVRERDARVAKG